VAVRALQADGAGGLDVLTLRNVPAPAAKPGQVLVRTVASTINPHDIKMRARPHLTFPITLGSDVAGVVVESDAPDYRPGDRVIAMTLDLEEGFGAWTDLIALNPDQLGHAPERVALTDAATIPLAGLAGLQLWRALALSPGDRVLVTGAAGAIGGFVVQLAVHAGMRVDGLVSRPNVIDSVKSLGAGFVTDDPDALPAHAYTAIVDPIRVPSGGVDVRKLVTDGGHYVAVGRNESGIPAGQAVNVDDDPAGLSHLVTLVDDGALTLRVAAHYGLHEFYDAHERFLGGGLSGKVVLHL